MPPLFICNMGKYYERLLLLQDSRYRDFTAKLIPSVDKNSFIGVRTPQLRALAREILNEGGYDDFLNALPHRYFEENMLHAFIVSMDKCSIDVLIERIEHFLPYMDNWAVCDQMSPKMFAKYPKEVYAAVVRWLSDSHEYTRRFAIVTLLQYFLDDNFSPSMLEQVATVACGEYYVNMAVAWYFSFALIKQWEYALPYITECRLPRDIHNMTIQKAADSFRISDERKIFLKGMRRRKNVFDKS